MIERRKKYLSKCVRHRHLYCTTDTVEEYHELVKFITNVRPLIASRFGLRERLVMYLKLAKKMGREEIRCRTGISERKIRVILREMQDYFSYCPSEISSRKHL